MPKECSDCKTAIESDETTWPVPNGDVCQMCWEAACADAFWHMGCPGHPQEVAAYSVTSKAQALRIGKFVLCSDHLAKVD